MKTIAYLLVSLSLVLSLPTAQATSFDALECTIASSLGDIKVVIPSTQQTLALIKPHAVAEGKVSDILKLIDLNRFHIARMEKLTLSKKQAEEFYAEHVGKPFFETLVTSMTSGPLIALKLEKDSAVTNWRNLIGSTNPKDAHIGTLRYIFAVDQTKNAVHGSSDPEAAQREIGIIFGSK